MKTTLLLTLCFAATAHAAEIDRVAAAITGSQAQFTQRFTPKGFKNSQIESGTVIFGVVPKMRWDYAKPEEKMFLFDGQKSWFYVPADRQVTVSELDEQKRSELPFLVIGDAQARERNFIVVEKTRGGAVVTTLQPRNAGGTIRTATITSSATSHKMQRLEYTDREGNRTVFDFSGFMMRGTEGLYFTPPPGVQVVQAQK